VERMLRTAQRTWAEVSGYLAERNEYYPADQEAKGLTAKQLQLVADWLTGKGA